MNDNSIICETSSRLENSKSQEDEAHAVVGSSATIPTPAPPQPVSKPMANKDKNKSAIRHAEKRRTSTCRFADRVAQLSVDHYKSIIPIKKRPPQTCIATILAHYRKHEDGRCDMDDNDNDNDPDNHGNVHKDDDKDRGAAGMLWILSMGVGTKFLSESCLRQEVENEKEDGYGSRVRDMHAEVLARRAFRRQLTLEIQEDLRVLEEEPTKRRLSCSETNTVPSHPFVGDRNNHDEQQGENLSILVRSNKDSTIRYMLRPGVTLHMYTSSAPCGNATLKKFCKMSKERFRDDLGSDEWPNAPHEPPSGSSIKLGEFSLLVKKDNDDNANDNNTRTSNNSNDIIASIDNNSSSDGGNRENGHEPTNTAAVPQSLSTMDQDNNIDFVKTKKRTRNEEKGSSSEQTKTIDEIKSLQKHKSPTRRGKPWPATLSDDWAPPGTTIVGFQQKGSIHTCSDKICRWNYLGLQGSLLAGILEEPLYLSTLTVGRKLSGSVCRRAICCRLDTRCRQPRLPKSSEKNLSASSSNDDKSINENKYRVNHPAVMGTSVYLDMGVVDTSNVDERGQDVRFHSSLVWSWWPGPPESRNNSQPHTKRTSDNGVLECIESSSGLLAQLLEENRHNHNADAGQSQSVAPKVSTKELTSLFLQVYHQASAARRKSTDPSCDASSSKSIDNNNNSDDEMGQKRYIPDLWYNNSISGIREIKKICSPMHETFKDLLLTEHKVLSQWRRREDRNKCKNCTDST